MIISFLAAILMAGAQIAQADTIAQFRWQNRVLLLFAPDDTDAALAEQRRILLADRDALSERKLVVLSVAGGKVESVFGPLPQGQTAAELRDRFQEPADGGFSAVLIGMDGGVKWRRDKPADLAEINAIIDAMPMRRKAS